MLAQTAAVCRGVVDLVQELDVKLPEQHHLVADLLRHPSLTLEHASQSLIDVWQVSHVVYLNFQHKGKKAFLITFQDLIPCSQSFSAVDNEISGWLTACRKASPCQTHAQACTCL